MSDLECPYCGAENEVCHDDGAGYSEDEAHEMECCECDKAFTFHTHISFSYHPEKADCLNDGDHPFGEWRTLWKDHGRTMKERGCKTCGKTERKGEPVQ